MVWWRQGGASARDHGGRGTACVLRIEDKYGIPFIHAHKKKKTSGGDTLSFSCFKNTMQLRLSWKAGCPYRTGWVTGMFKVNRGGKQVWLSVMSNMERWAERNVRPKYAWKSQCRHKESTLVKPHSTTSYIITASGLANLYASLICASNW